MTHTYHIAGMTCGHCVSKVKSTLLKLGDVTGATIQLTPPQAAIQMQKHIPVRVLQDALSTAGTYTITEADGGMHHTAATGETRSFLETYKPIFLIGAFITGITILIELKSGALTLESWMQNFMAGFFLTFSFFKLLDVTGFADSYGTYDIIAKRWRGWGFVYPFIELALGIAFLLRFNPLLTNGVTFAVMSVSIIGVLQSVLNKKKIKCACLGAVFNLPMSTVTVIEDGLMIIMSAVMFMHVV